MAQSVDDLPPDVRDALVDRLESSPVELALLFGSYAAGRATAGSDVDVAVEYEEGVADVMDAHLALVADLTRILGRDDVDIVRLTAVDPRIAVEALEHGQLLVGTREDVRRLRNRLEGPRRAREEAVRSRIEEAERAIERRLRRREHG
jgi:predicted nucleotidyltransferase